MHTTTIFLLFLITQCVGAVSFCSSSSIGSTTIAPTTITSQVATGCTLNSNALLYFTGTNIPSLPTAGIVDMQFIGGTVSYGGYIQITGPTTANAATLVPMKVLVSGNSFASATAVLVTGSFPPDSNITISFNTFVSSVTCPSITWRVSYAFVNVISFADVVPIVMYARASLSAQYNNIDTNSGTNYHSIPFVVNAITFYANASAGIRGNTIKTHGNAAMPSQNTWVILFDYINYVVSSQTACYFRYFGGGGRWEFDDNWMQATTENPNIAYVGNSPTIVDAPQGGTFSISRNYFKAVPITTAQVNPCYGMTSGNVGTNFKYYFAGNTVEVYNWRNTVSTFGATFDGNSLVVISDNTFISVNALAGFYLTVTAIVLKGTSRMLVNNNSFRSLAGAAFYDAIQFGGVTLTDTATLTTTGNSIDALTRSTTYKLFSMASSSIPATSKVTVCDNRYFGTRLNKFSILSGSNAAFVAMPLQYCARTESPRITHTLTSTSSVTLSPSFSTSVSQTLTSTSSLTVSLSPSTSASPSSSLTPSTSNSSRPSSTQSVHHSETRTRSNTSEFTKSLTSGSTPSLQLSTSVSSMFSRTASVSTSVTRVSTASRTSGPTYTTTTTATTSATTTPTQASPSDSSTLGHPPSRSAIQTESFSASLLATRTHSVTNSNLVNHTLSYISMTTSVAVSASDSLSLIPPPTVAHVRTHSTSGSVAVSDTHSGHNGGRGGNESHTPTGYFSESVPLSQSANSSATEELKGSHSVGFTGTLRHMPSSMTEAQIKTFTPPVTTETIPGPTNATILPDPIVQNAPEWDSTISDAVFQSALETGSAAIMFQQKPTNNKCQRVELLLLSSTILTPIFNGGGRSADDEGSLFSLQTYDDAIIMNGIVLITVLALGLTTTISRHVFWPTTGGLAKSASAVRFPATAIQTFIFLSSGTAVAAGLSLAKENGGLIAPIVATALLLIIPVVWLTWLRCTVRHLNVKIAEDDFTIKDGEDDEDVIHRETIRPTRRQLVCAEVRPSMEAKMFGPVCGDLRLHPLSLSSLWPAALPILLLIVSLVIGFTEACEHLPMAMAVLIILYALVIIAFRPFLGFTHNAAEIVWSTCVAGCLLGLWFAFRGDDSFLVVSDPSTHETALLLCIGCILNCRYPFVLARSLDVVVPRVVSASGLLSSHKNAIVGTAKSQRTEPMDAVEEPMLLNASEADAEGSLEFVLSDAVLDASDDNDDTDGEDLDLDSVSNESDTTDSDLIL